MAAFKTIATIQKSRKDITESRWQLQQAREDAMERSWEKRNELSRLANLFGV